MNDTVEYFAFCDGSAPQSSLVDPKPGYFCAVILRAEAKNTVQGARVSRILDVGPDYSLAAVVCGHHDATTSPRMEFVAAFEALKWIAQRNQPAAVTVVSDHENLIKFLAREYKCTKGCETVVMANGGKLDANKKFIPPDNLSISAEHVNAFHAKNKTKPTHFLNQVADFFCTFIEPGSGFCVTTITDGASNSGKVTTRETYV